MSPRSPHKLTSEQYREIYTMLDADPNSSRVAAAASKKFGFAIAVHQVGYMAKKAGIELTGRSNNGKRKFTPEQNKQILMLLEEERNASRVVEMVSEKFGMKVTSMTIWLKAKAAGIELVGHKKNPMKCGKVSNKPKSNEPQP